jgi:NAD(P)-dependent dehydrogenase (short-subunit alcohol dehydrogenase family)
MKTSKAIVTGHSRGLGAALARQLQARGVDVLGLARQHLAAPAAAPADSGVTGALQEVELDLSDTAALSAWLSGGALARFLENADCVYLINNAGMVDPVGPIATHAADALIRAVNLNVSAPLVLAAAFAKASAAAADRRIVHVSSGAGRKPTAGWSAYCATKAALDHHARAVVLDDNQGVRICSLAPGVVDTEMQGAIRASSLEAFPQRERFEELKRSGALATPEDTAQKIIAYMLSDAFGAEPVADIRDVAINA